MYKHINENKYLYYSIQIRYRHLVKFCFVTSKTEDVNIFPITLHDRSSLLSHTVKQKDIIDVSFPF